MREKNQKYPSYHKLTRNAVDENGLVHLVLHSAIAGEIKVASKAISSGLQVLAVPLKSL